MKFNLARLALSAVAAGALALTMVPVLQAENDVEQTFTAEKLLVRVTSTDVTSLISTTDDRIVTIGKPAETDTVPITTGWVADKLPRCGSKCNTAACDNSMAVVSDGDFSTGSTYYGGYGIILHEQNGKPGRVPSIIYSQSSTAITAFPNPGKRLTGLAFGGSSHDSGLCAEPVEVTSLSGKKATETWTFVKLSVTMD